MPISWNPTTWISRLIDDRMNVAGVAMVATARAFAAEDTGYMKAHIRYAYNSSTKTLSLISEAHYSLAQEFGTYQMPAHPFLRPALNAVAPSFLTGKLTGVSTQVMIGTSLDVDHTPRNIRPHIRPRISAANRIHNIGATARSEFVAVHMNRQNQVRRKNVGLKQESRVVTSSLTKSRLNKIRQAWN